MDLRIGGTKMAAHHTSVTECNVIIDRHLLRDHGRMFSVIRGTDYNRQIP
jgi:hypothetical protein